MTRTTEVTVHEPFGLTGTYTCSTVALAEMFDLYAINSTEEIARAFLYISDGEHDDADYIRKIMACTDRTALLVALGMFSGGYPGDGAYPVEKRHIPSSHYITRILDRLEQDNRNELILRLTAKVQDEGYKDGQCDRFHASSAIWTIKSKYADEHNLPPITLTPAERCELTKAYADSWNCGQGDAYTTSWAERDTPTPQW
jgi:hypothetical protein